VDQGAGVVVFVAAQRLTGDPVDAGQAVEPAPHQHRVDRGGRDAQPAADLHRSQPLAPPQPNDLLDHRQRRAGGLVVRS
jgi:hypothetical protein